MKRAIFAAIIVLVLFTFLLSGAYFRSENLYTPEWSYYRNVCNLTQQGSGTTEWYSEGGYGGLKQTTGGGCLFEGLFSYDETYETKLTIRQADTGGGNFLVLINPLHDQYGLLSSFAYSVRLTCGPWGGLYIDTQEATVLAVSTSCSDNMAFRVIRYGGHVLVYRNGDLLADVPYTYLQGWNRMSFQVDSHGAGNLATHVALGGVDYAAPNAIPAGNVGISSYYNHIDLQWPAAIDTDSGVAYYRILRNGATLATTQGLTFSDTTVVPNSQYTYTLQAVDFFGNASNTNVNASSLTIPTSGPFPSEFPEGRRVGIRPTGTYWGAGGENLDVRSGNLNFSIPLIKPTARGGMAVPFNLTYNSQNWRQDSGGHWKYGVDVGYGFGWRLMAGSITPVFSNPYTISHYLFIDSSGAEYRLDQNSGSLWTSKESVYVTFDASLNRLYFNSGVFWEFGCVSAASEPDGGVMYPTLMEDTNGNRILVRYQTAPGASWTNSSARIKEIEDVRAKQLWPTNNWRTYSFTYSTDSPPHLISIQTETGLNLGESYTFDYLLGQPLISPFSNYPSFGTTAFLRRVTSTAANTYNEFTYNVAGEVINIRLPQGGYFAYVYWTSNYSSGRKFREVAQRHLSKDGSTQTNYQFYREASPVPDVHPYAVLVDPSGVGHKYWSFATSGAAMGLNLQYVGYKAPTTFHHTNDFTWTQDAAGNSYIGANVTTLDAGQTYWVSKKTEQTVNTYGNVTQVKNYPFGNLVTPARTYNYTYLTTSAYVNKYIRNRLTQASLTDSAGSITLATIAYDQTTPAQVSGSPRQWNTALTSSITTRGNVTATSTTAGATANMAYDVTGGVTSTTVNGIYTTSATSSNVNFAAPTQVTTGSFADAMNYDVAIRPTNVTTPTSTLSIGYDSAGRVSTTNTYGSIATTSYNLAASPPTIIKGVNGVGTTYTLDGLGRPIKAANADGITDTEYDSCGCSPLGKVKRVSLPHAYGTNPTAWTTYTYDAIGRTTHVVGPDGVSTTTYVYEANTVKVTDPAGKWKKFTMDAFGQLTQVNEPNPAGGADYVTNYTYDRFGHLATVSMPRPTGTQTRSFAWYPDGRPSSSSGPENSAAYTYHSGTLKLATRTDGKGQQVAYDYDSYNRVTTVRRHTTTAPLTEDTCQRETYSYDTNPYDATFTQYGNGRLTAVQYRGGAPGFSWPEWGSNCSTLFTEMYSYNQGGAVVKKRLRVTRWKQTGPSTYDTLNTDLDETANYDSNARMTDHLYPPQSKTSAGGTGAAGPNLAYTYTANTGRLATMADLTTSQTVIAGVNFNVAGEMTSMAGQYVETRTYNSLFQLTGLVAPGVNTTYAYSATQNNGKIASQTDNLTGETVQYTYDSLNRLATAVATNNSWGQSYTYDGFGNLTNQTVIAGSAPTLSVSYNPATNRQNGECADANGNIGSAPCSLGYGYDIENRLTAVSGASYSYAPGNKRVWRSTGDEVTFYGIRGQKLATYAITMSPCCGPNVMTLTQTGTWWYFGGKLVKNAAGYVGQDRIGSVGNKYFPYGQERIATANGVEKFGTYFRDSETGLDYAQNRYHQPGMGRFLTPDPYMASGGPSDPGSWNRYAYAGGDPITFNDPSGLLQNCPTGDGCTTPPALNCSTSPPAPGCNTPMPDPNNAECVNYPDAEICKEPVDLTPPPVGVPLKITGGTLDQQKALREAFDAAMRRLNNPNSDCWDFLGGYSTFEKFVNTEYRIVPFGPGTQDKGAQTNGPTDVFINSIGFFFGQNVFDLPSNPGQFTYVDLGSGLTGVNLQALLLLHELGHQGGILRSPDSGPGAAPDANRLNTQDILDHCFTKLPNGKYF